MAPLPVDFGGPLITKQGRGETHLKRYLCLFTCLAPRAVHLEVAFSLDTDSFLNASFQIPSQHGLPEDVVCGKGTNFVSGSNELKELEALDKKKLQDTSLRYGVIWHFNPPLARVVQYTQLESIRLWYLRFDQPKIDSGPLFHPIDTNRFPFCRSNMPEVDLRET